MFTHLPTLQDVSELTEEEQLALALQMSMQQGDMEAELQPMDTDTTPAVAQSTEVRVRWQLTLVSFPTCGIPSVVQTANAKQPIEPASHETG